MKAEIQNTVREYILKEFLLGESDGLTETTPLITGAILDSIGTLKLVSFLEERYAITFRAHEVDTKYLNTISDISNLVLSKKG
jgi:acyl carrier protein